MDPMNLPREENPTIYDVARQSGLSIATVSRVLNSPQQVTLETREKVLKVIDDLGYVPRAEARARAIRGTRRIGVLTPFFTSPSFVERLRGIAFILGKTNYELIVYTVDSSSRLSAYLTSLPLTSSLDGLIILSLPLFETDARRLMDHRVVTVVIEYEQEYFSSVEIDNTAGGEMAGKYLLEKGHHHIGFIGEIHPPDYAIRPALARLNGLRKVLAEADIHLPEELIQSAPIDQESTCQAALKLLNLPERPTAIFAAADFQAMALIKVATDMGLKIPGDLAVLGFDGLETSEFMSLTTINQSLDDSGRIAAELLLAQLSNASQSVRHVKLPLTLVERETV
jgi:DNA-binding LacI/PurR family transcriptional regulator